MQQHLQAIITVLSLVNPAVCAGMFARIEFGRSKQEMLKDATQAVVAVLVILTLAALAGVQFLHQFGISLDAFKVAGGVVLSWMGFNMLSANRKPSAESRQKSESPSLTQLILFAASPGTITGVITIASDHSESGIPWRAIIAVCVAVSVTWPLIVLAASSGGQGKQGLVRETASRFMGLIVLAMGIQYALTGLKSFFGPLST